MVNIQSRSLNIIGFQLISSPKIFLAIKGPPNMDKIKRIKNIILSTFHFFCCLKKTSFG